MRTGLQPALEWAGEHQQRRFQMDEHIMNTWYQWAQRALVVVLVCSPLAANADVTTPALGGETTVQLGSSFVSALTSLHVVPGAVGPGRIYELRGATYAAFPITTGAIDIRATRLEVDHSGGLSLTAGDTVVTLSAFIIQADPKAESVLTGIVTVNGTLVGRIPLFDLSIGKAKVWVQNRFTDIDNVTLKLSATAAEALGGAFHTSIPQLQVGSAQIRTLAAGYNDL
jgi:hypothetical protein